MQRKGKFFVRFLISYILLLIVPMSIGLHAYYQTVSILREEATQLNYVVLEQTEENLNRLLSEIRNVVTQLSLGAELLQLMLTADASWSPQTLYNFAEERKKLNQVSTNKFFSMLYVYLKKSETILSTDLIERVEQHPLRIGDQPFGEWIESSIHNNQMNHFRRIENVSGGSKSGNYIAYVNSLPSGYGSSASGALVVLIDEQSIIQLLSPLLEDQRSFAFIADSDNQMIASTSAGNVPIDLLELPNEGRKNSFISEINDQKMLITHMRNPENERIFVAGLPIETVFSKADYIKRINWIIALIALALSCMIAFLLAYRNSKPLMELLESIKEFASGDAIKQSNDMEVLRNTVHQIVSNNKNLHIRMNKQLPIMQASCLELLLKTGFQHERDWRQRIEAAQIQIFDDHVVVVIIKIFGVEYVLSEEEGVKSDQRKQQTIAALNRVGSEGCYVHEVKMDELAYIYSFTGIDVDAEFNLLVERLEDMQEKLLQEFSIMTSIAIGQVYHSVMDLWRSYNEAVQTLEVQDPDTPQQLLRFDTSNHNANQYYYPLDLELKLMNMVRVGDPSGLERLFEHIENQNFQIRQLNTRSKKQLLLEMQGTLQKLTEQVQNLIEIKDFELDHIYSVSLDAVDMTYKHLKSAFFYVCEQMLNQNSNKQRSMLESIKVYLADHFRDSNISLCKLASEYKQTESFLSVYFKDQTGKTFSEYLENLRLYEACRLLKESAMPVQDIAIQIGYNSDKSFRRAFKRVYGIQPTYYRKNN